MWRPVISEPQIATLTEIKKYWSINDLFDAHEVLDIREEIRADANKGKK